MQLVREGQIETNEQLLTGCSEEDAATINSDPELTDREKFAALLNPAAYKFQRNNPYVIKDAQNYPALFSNLNNPMDFVISRGYQTEFQNYETQLRRISRTQGAFENSWNATKMAWHQMKLGALNSEKMDANESSDVEKLKEIEEKIQKQQEKIDELTPPSRQSFGATFGSLVASTGRVLPELVITGAATAALAAAAPETGGATAVGAAVTAGRFARAIARIKSVYSAYRATKLGVAAAKGAGAINAIANASLIYNDTSNIGRGNMYSYLSEKYPEMSEDEIQQKAWVQGRLEGAFEAATSFIGLAAIGGRTMYKTASRAMFKRTIATAVEKEVGTDIEKAAAKKAISNLVETGVITPELASNNTFVRGMINKLVKLREGRIGKAAEFGLDMIAEGATEVYQNEIERTIQEMGVGEKTGYIDALSSAQSNINTYFGEMYDYVVNGTEMSPEAQSAFTTFTDVALGSALIGSAFTGIDLASKRIFRGEAQSLGNQLDHANRTISSLDKVLEQKGNSEAGKKSPETLNNFYKNAVKAGELPETLYVRLDKLKEILTKMKDDPTAMAKLNAMKVGEKMTEASNDGGLVEFDTSDFINNVVDPKNDTLYQTIKGSITSNPAMNSKDDIFSIIEDIGKSDQMIKQSVENPDSIYNMVYDNQKKAGSDENLAKVNAIIAQSVFNTFQRMRTDKPLMDTIVEQIKLKIENVDKITAAELSQFAGEKAITASSEMLSKAKVMEQNNVPMYQILKDTGWFNDPNDNRWKFEISDKDAKINESTLSNIFSNKMKDATLKDILQHESLYAAYPMLADIQVKYNSHLKNTLGAVYTKNGQSIMELAKTKDIVGLRETILHEVSHLIQRKEGFARGGQPKGRINVPEQFQESYIERQKLQNQLWEDLKKSGVKPTRDTDTSKYYVSHWAIMSALPTLRKIAEGNKDVQDRLQRLDELNKRLKKVDEHDPIFKYLNIPGENEARDVAYRADMTDEERAEILPSNLMGTMAPMVRFKIGDEITEIPSVDDVGPQISGSIEFGVETVIRLSKIANPTTFSHEMAHLFGRQLFGNYNAGLLTEHWAKNAEKLVEFLGIEKNEFGQYQFAGNTAAEEKFAEAFTSYLKTGKAPVGYLKELFDLVKEWFSNVYTMLRMNDVPLNRKVTKVFDEIFVPYEKQKQILIERRYGFIAKPDTMTEEQYQKYISEKRAAASRGQTQETKMAAKLQEVMSNETYKSEYEDAYRKAYDDIGALPVYQMIDYVIQQKINKKSLEKIAQDVKLPRNYLSSKDGLDIAQVYAQFTDIATSADELAVVLAETPSREIAADYAAKEHMKEWLQENYPDVAEIDSELAARNERAFKLSVMEYMMLSGIGMERFNQIHNDMLSVAEYMVQRMPLRKIANVQRWIEQESNLMQRYDYTLSDTEKAKIKRQQAFLNYYAMRGKQIRQESQRFIRKSRKYRGPQTKEVLKTIDGTTFDLLKSMLNRFKLSTAKTNTDIPMGARIENWVQMMVDKNYSGADEISRYTEAIIQGVEKTMTTADFDLLKNAFGFVESAGKKLKMIQIGDREVLIESAARLVADSMARSSIKPFEKELGMGTMRETVFKAILPEDVFLDFISPMFTGLTRKDIQIQKWRNELADIIKPFGKNLQKAYIIDGRSYTTEQLFVMMLNSGNTHNINCMVKTMQVKLNDIEFTTDALFSVLEQAPKELREATRRVWQIFDNNKEAFQEAQTKIDGKVLKFVEAQPYTFADGEKMPGGYYPAGKVSLIRNYDKESTIFNNTGTYATKSFQMDRVGAHADLDLTLNTLNAWFYKMAGVLHVALPYNNLGKLLRNDTFRNAVGDGMVKTIADWMELSIAPERVNKFLSAVNQFVSIKVLGAAPIKMFTQMSGMIPAMAEYGIGNVINGLLRTNPITVIKDASNLSEYMFARYAHPEDHLQLYMRSQDILGKSIEKMNALQLDKVMNFAMSFIIYGDAIASSATWKAEYYRQLNAGKTKSQASDLADSAVRSTQGDSSAGSRPPLLQGNLRFFTMFSSYFIGIHSLLVAHKIKGEYAKMAGLLFAAAVAAPMFEAFFNTAKDWIAADDDDKKKWKKEKINNVVDLYIDQSVGNILSSAGSFWLPHFGVGSSLGTALAKGKVYEPRNMQIEYMLKPIEIGTQLAKAAQLKYQGKTKKSKRSLKKGLKNIFEFGMMNSSISDRLSNLLTGE